MRLIFHCTHRDWVCQQSDYCRVHLGFTYIIYELVKKFHTLKNFCAASPKLRVLRIKKNINKFIVNYLIDRLLLPWPGSLWLSQQLREARSSQACRQVNPAIYSFIQCCRSTSWIRILIHQSEVWIRILLSYRKNIVRKTFISTAGSGSIYQRHGSTDPDN